MTFFARLHAVILLAIISMVAASLVNSKSPTLAMHAYVIGSTETHFYPDLDVFEETHRDSSEGVVVYGRVFASYSW